MEGFDFFQPIVFTVTALNAYLRELLETDEVLQDLWVRGEISNFSQPRSGHLYFTLKDSEAAMRCVMWKPSAMRLRFTPADGMLVEAHGALSIYPAQGQVQLYVDALRPAGEGIFERKVQVTRAWLGKVGNLTTHPQVLQHFVCLQKLTQVGIERGDGKYDWLEKIEALHALKHTRIKGHCQRRAGIWFLFQTLIE